MHLSCAQWCNGVKEKGKGLFENLEFELVRAISQRCCHCGNFGAGLICTVPNCTGALHFSCAATSGSFQESSARSTVCFNHADLVISLGKDVKSLRRRSEVCIVGSGRLNHESWFSFLVGSAATCTVCNEVGNLASLVMCCTCGHQFHASCMALNSNPSM